MKITKFEELNIWKLALKITKEIYDLTAKKEFSRDFQLRDQVRRAIISVSSKMVGYVTKHEFDKTNKELEDLAAQIGGFIVYLQKRRQNKEFLTR